MSSRTHGDTVLHQPPTLRASDLIPRAVRALLDSGLPALPVLDDDDHYQGIFGEREFMTALFPGYVKQLRGAAFLSSSLDDALGKREGCREETVGEHLNAEHIDVGPDWSDTQLAEIFLHHRVLLVPVIDDGRLLGIITRAGFVRALAEGFLEGRE